MKPTSQPVENSGASGSPVAPLGKAAAKSVASSAPAPAPMVEAPAVTPPAAKAPASRPVAARTETSPPLEYSPGVAELSPAERRAAFMAAAAEPRKEAPQEEPHGELNPDTPAESAETTTEETETEDAPASKEKAPEDMDDDELVSGLAKHAEKSPELKGLLKRTQKVLKQNSERRTELDALKAELESKRAAPPVVLAPSAENPLSHLTTPEQVDAEVEAILDDARSRARWLDRHLEDDVPWNEGTANEQPMTLAQKAKALNYYEKIRDQLAAKWGDARKEELATYAATLKELDVAPEDLVKPTVPTRESKLFERVPELMRDPAYLQFLADAKAGREAREEKRRGVKVVKVDPAKVKTEAVKSSAESTPSGTPRQPVEVTSTDLEALRVRASKGDETARAAMRRAFVQQIN